MREIPPIRPILDTTKRRRLEGGGVIVTIDEWSLSAKAIRCFEFGDCPIGSKQCGVHRVPTLELGNRGQTRRLVKLARGGFGYSGNRRTESLRGENVLALAREQEVEECGRRRLRLSGVGQRSGRLNQERTAGVDDRDGIARSNRMLGISLIGQQHISGAGQEGRQGS